MCVKLLGHEREFMLERTEWLGALLLVGLETDWSQRPGRRLDREETRRFGEMLERALDRLPDEDAREDRNVFPRRFWGSEKARLRRVVDFARGGAFVVQGGEE